MRSIVSLCCLVGFTSCASQVTAQQTTNPFESAIPETARTADYPSDVRAIKRDNLPSWETATTYTPKSIPSDTAVTIGAVSVQNTSQIPAQLLAKGYEKFIGLEASEDNLRALASAVSQSARDGGYVFASAKIPPQSVKIGVVSVQLDPGAIDEVRILGSQNRRLRKILDQLKCNAAESKIVERQLLLAGDLPGIKVKDTKYVREDGRGVLVVTVREDRINGSAGLDNHGPSSLGPVRARLNYNLAGLLSDDDVLTVNAINSVPDTSELTYINIRYAKTLGDGSTVVGFSGSAGRTFTGGGLNNFNYRGRNRYASVFASHALQRSSKSNLWVNAKLAYLQVLQTEDSILFQDDKIVTASLDFAGNYDIGIGRIYGGIGVTQGLGVLGASSAGELLNSRDNGSGSFTKANIWVNSILNLGDGFGVRLAGNAQISSRALLSANEIAFGGNNFGRGYDYSERFGDEGVMGLAEIRKGFNNVTNWLDWVQVYGFVDGGYITNIGTGFGNGSLASAGGGFRAQIGKIDLGVEAAAPINNDRFESGDQSPKVNMQVGVSF